MCEKYNFQQLIGAILTIYVCKIIVSLKPVLKASYDKNLKDTFCYCFKSGNLT